MSEHRLSRYLHAKGARLGLPISGTFELTPRCNFSCRMCYIRLSAQEQQALGTELTAAQWISLGEQAKQAGTVFLLLTGGEPTLRPDFPEIYTALKKMGFLLSVNTNAYLLTGELRTLFLNDPPNRINVTLYGTNNETYERMCGIPAYERIIENIRALKAGGISVKCNFSLTPDNAAQLPELFRVARELGAYTQAVSYMFPPRRRTLSCNDGDFRLSAEDAGRFRAEYERIALSPEAFEKHRQALYAGILPPSGEDCDGASGQQMLCRAGKTCYWVTWDGKLLPCGQMPTPAVALQPDGFQTAWEQLRREADQIRMSAACAVCEKKHACHACAAMCYCETGAFDRKPDYLCRMTDAYLHAITEETK